MHVLGTRCFELTKAKRRNMRACRGTLDARVISLHKFGEGNCRVVSTDGIAVATVLGDSTDVQNAGAAIAIDAHHKCTCHNTIIWDSKSVYE